MGIIEEERNYLEARVLLASNPIGGQIIYTSDVINSKVSALLTHVSIMLAVATGFLVYLMSNRPKSHILISSLFLEDILYAIITLFCLRSIFMSSATSDKDIEVIMVGRMIHMNARRKSYAFALRLTFAATVALILTVAIDGLQMVSIG